MLKFELNDSEIVYSSDYFNLVLDKYPVSPWHMLIIAKDPNKVDYFDLTYDESCDLLTCIDDAIGIIENRRGMLRECKPDGYNIGMNCGKAAGQTVMQFHCHIIPRYLNMNVEDPRGGVRHAVLGKGYYTVPIDDSAD